VAALQAEAEPGQALDGTVVELGGQVGALLLGDGQHLVDQAGPLLLRAGLDGPLPRPGALDPPQQQQGKGGGHGRDRQHACLRPALRRGGGRLVVDGGAAEQRGKPLEARVDLLLVDPPGGGEVAGLEQAELVTGGGQPVTGGGVHPLGGRVVGQQDRQLGEGLVDLPAGAVQAAPQLGVGRDLGVDGLPLQRVLLVGARLQAEEHRLSLLPPVGVPTEAAGADQGGRRDRQQADGKQPLGRRPRPPSSSPRRPASRQPGPSVQQPRQLLRPPPPALEPDPCGLRSSGGWRSRPTAGGAAAGWTRPRPR
jgi:hypothetical protein